MRVWPVLLAALVLTGCGSTPRSRDPPPAGPAPGAAPATGAPVLCGPLRVAVTGRVADPGLTELSGLATGTAGTLWAVEDSGAPPVLIGLRADGTVTTRAAVTGATNVDWEDVGTLDGPRGPEVVVADVGDNAAARGSVQVYRVPEPATGVAATAPATRLDLRYPDGAHDAETVLADPLRDEVVLVTKTLRGARAYSAPLDSPASATLRRGPAVAVAIATGGAVSGDGRIVVVRTYTGLVVWRRDGRERLTRTLRRAPDCVARPSLLREGQGEAVALDRRGRSARTVAEAARAPLRRYAP